MRLTYQSGFPFTSTCTSFCVYSNLATQDCAYSAAWNVINMDHCVQKVFVCDSVLTAFELHTVHHLGD